MLEDTEGNGDANALAEMCADMEKFCRQNQVLEDNVRNIQ